MKIKKYSPNDLMALAKEGKLAPYEGGAAEIALLANGRAGYGGPNERGGYMRGRVMTINVTNANAASRTLLLCPGLDSGASGLIQTGAFNDVNGDAGLSASGSPQAIELFNQFIQKVPSLMSVMKINSDVAGQIEQILTVKHESPFKSAETKTFPLSQYTDEYANKEGVATVEEDIQFDDQTRIELPIVGSSTTTLSLFFSEVFNVAGIFADQWQGKASAAQLPGRAR